MTVSTGVRLVLANCADPSREAEFNQRYDAYAAALTEPGYFVSAARFTAAESPAKDELPKYAALYEIALADPGEAWPLTSEHSGRVVGQLSGLLDVRLRATYARLRPSALAEPPPDITLVLSDPVEGVCPGAVAAWLGAVHDTSGFVLVEGSPDPPLFLEVRAAAVTLATSGERARLLQPRLSAHYRRVFWHQDARGQEARAASRNERAAGA